jgi:hypothetical protein
MDLGKQVRVIEIPDVTPARRPIEEPNRRNDEELIPLPDNWPRRAPAHVPDKAGEWTQR